MRRQAVVGRTKGRGTRGRIYPHLAALAVVVLAVPGTSFGDTASTGERGPYEQGGVCLKALGAAYHDYQPPDKTTTSTYVWSGRFRAESQAAQDYNVIHIGGTIHCGAQRLKGSGELGVRFILLKRALVNNQWVVAICKDTGWSFNDVTTYWHIREMRSADAADGHAICGDGFYKLQTYHKMLESSTWVPASQPCKDGQEPGNPPTCIKGYLTPWHWFPWVECIQQLCQL